MNVSDSRFYREIDKITDLLMQRIIKIKDIGNKEFEKYHWVEVVKYKNGNLKLKINRELKPFYLSLDWYTKYQLKNIMQFKSTYSFRLYELLKQYENIGNRLITVNDLRIALDIDKNHYSKYANLKQKVINVVLKEINNNTDLHIEIEELKEVRKVIAIKFNIKQNKARIEIAEGSIKEYLTVQDKNINLVKTIIKTKVGEEISNRIANTFYKNAVKNKIYGENPLDLIKEVAEYSKTQNMVKGFVAWFTGTIEGYKRPIPKNRTIVSDKGTFNNYEQRTYDYDDLEKKLLGWDNEIDEATGEEYQQARVNIE